MSVEKFADGSEIITDLTTGLRTVVGKSAHDEYFRRLKVERDTIYGVHQTKPFDCLTVACGGDAVNKSKQKQKIP